MSCHTQQEIGGRIGWSREKVRDHIKVLDGVGADILKSAREYQDGRAPSDGAIAPTFDFTEGWSREKVAQHTQVLERVVTDILDFARQHQEGRVTEDVTVVTNFTEGWFRNSGRESRGDVITSIRGSTGQTYIIRSLWQREQARRRQATSGEGVYGGKPLKENLPEAVPYQTRDAVGAELGMSGWELELPIDVNRKLQPGMSCHTQEEIAAAVDLAAGPINEKIKQCSDLETFPKQSKVLATFQDEQFTTPLRYKERIAARAKENERLGGKGSQKSADHNIDTRAELARSR